MEYQDISARCRLFFAFLKLSGGDFLVYGKKAGAYEADAIGEAKTAARQ